MKKSLIIFLVIMESFMIFLSYKSYKSKEVILDDVKIKENITNRNAFALMIQQSNGTYTESASNTFPTTGYYFNQTKSGCIDENGNTIENVLGYANSKVTVSTYKTVYCYLYFDLSAPTPTFYIGGSSNPTDLNTENTTIYLAWSTNNVESYCINTTNSTTGCSWVDLTSAEKTAKTVTSSYTLTGGDGTKSLYAFLKSSGDNISSSATDSVNLDTRVWTYYGWGTTSQNFNTAQQYNIALRMDQNGNKESCALTDSVGLICIAPDTYNNNNLGTICANNPLTMSGGANLCYESESLVRIGCGVDSVTGNVDCYADKDGDYNAKCIVAGSLNQHPEYDEGCTDDIEVTIDPDEPDPFGDL